ncbi:ATP-NAD kinase family protein [Oscillibacter hominis]|uniref:ATP-NAD kinase family protein n=1 Tax=Oscillibacter hominis TaxID=2763056 RepID=A0A7G9B1F6_9FIRM|nr:ATP-NAD kinase family protein [Oscillibacter hominis]QNL43387.1 ATP-NAD kinase family protein [Oscillibacter hominis]
MKTLGLLINPIAGMGGSVGLKGTDGMYEEAVRRGAVRKANDRAAAALKALLPLKDDLLVLCASGEMGEDLAKKLGFRVQVVYTTCTQESSASDTIAAARAMKDADLLLFAGGDGTARDVVSAVGSQKVALGIPAGVKIHSPVYAIRPEAAGSLALNYLKGGCAQTREAEVVDIDESAYREGRVSTSLYGYLQVPYERRFLQSSKAPSPLSEHSQQVNIAWEMIDQMKPDLYYLVGPGSTTKTLMDVLGLPDTLIGVDLILNKQLVQSDLCEQDILRRMDERETHLIITPTGGQGFLLGRGNQQLSAAVMRRIGRERLHVLATQEKLFHLQGSPLLVDTGDSEVDDMLSGYVRVIINYMEEQICKIGRDRN